MPTQPTLVLDRVLRVMKPLVRLLVRQGITYPAFAAALKRVFVDASAAELAAQGRAGTDSAVTLMSGVHRRDLRELRRAGPTPDDPPGPVGLVAEVIARWTTEAPFADARGIPQALERSGDEASFDALVAGISQDVRPRAVLDELLRLAVVRELADGRLRLDARGFAPRRGFEELSWLFAANLHDHAAAAAANLQGEDNFLEQSVFVDRLHEASIEKLHLAAADAWQQALRQVMREAKARFDADSPSPDAKHRARFGVYFYSERED